MLIRPSALPPQGFAGTLALVALSALAPVPVRAAFTDVTVTYGVAYGDSMSYSAGFVDYDGDMDPDLYVNNHWKGPEHLYRNDGPPPFASNSAHFGAGNSDRHDQLWADFDNDGDPDEYILHSRIQANELFWNNGCDVFVEGAVAAGVDEPNSRGRELAIADFNGDNLLDMFLANDFRAGFPSPNRLYWNDGDGTFTAQPNTDPVFDARLHVSAADYDLDGAVDVILTSESFHPGALWRNNGDSTFTDITATAFPGITLPLEQGQGLSWADYDNDGLLDLLTTGGNRGVWDYAAVEGDSVRFYVDADTNQTKIVDVVTDGDSVTVWAVGGSWQTLSLWYGGGGSSVSAYPATFALTQLDGTPPALTMNTQGLYLWRMPGAAADTVRLVAGGAGGAGLLEVGGSIRPNGSGILSMSTTSFVAPPPYSNDNWSNRLFHNEGDGTFTEVTATAFAVNDSTFNSKGAAWADYDNDGNIDVFIANGGTVETHNQPNWLFRNNGDGTFTEMAVAEGVDGTGTRGMSDGGCWGDINGDGALDLFVDNGAEHAPIGVGPRQLFLNATNANHWVRLTLRGLTSNGSGIGARVRVLSATAGEQWRYRLGESDNSFANDASIHFGLGADTVMDTVQVFWPAGQVDTYTQVSVDATYFAIEGKPLRSTVNPHFIVLTPSISQSQFRGQSAQLPFTVDNFGGLASHYYVSYEDCTTGLPITWLSVDVESTTVWPGGRPPIQVKLDSSGLAGGTYCGNVIFHSNSFLGPDTLQVNYTVVDPAVGVDVTAGIPDHFGLARPRPNPTRGAAALDLALPSDAPVDVSVFDVSGRRVARILSGYREAGWHRARWDLRDEGGNRVATGMYLIRATSGSLGVTRKLVVID